MTNRVFFNVAAGVVLLDQLTKLLVTQGIGLYEEVTVIPGFFVLTNVRNPGAAWGLFRQFPDVLTALAVAAAAGIALFRRALARDHFGQEAALAILLGGVLGNVLDRARLGSVVDFLEFDLGFMQWPTFNLADASICVGVGLYLMLSLLHARHALNPTLGPVGPESPAVSRGTSTADGG